MAEKLRLTKRDKSTLRISIPILIAIILASAAAGYVLASQATITGDVVKDSNCIPQEDLQFFIDQSNVFQEAYMQCEEKLWTLGFAYKQATAADEVVVE